MKIDLHCHLDLFPNPDEIVLECNKRGLYVLSVTTIPSAFLGTQRIASQSPRIKTALGFHPELAHLRENEIQIFDILLSQAKYIGEIGLDGSPGFKPYQAVQLRVFNHILQKVHLTGGRIMSIHSRSSVEYVVNSLKNIDGIPIFHWFTGSLQDLKLAISTGGWFSVGPAMISSSRGREIIKRIPKDRLLTETDSPFSRYNGKPLKPWDVDLAISGISKIWGCSSQEAESTIGNNFRRILE